MATAQKILFTASAPVERIKFTLLQGGKSEEKSELFLDSFVLLIGYLTVLPIFFSFLFLNVEKYNFSKKRIVLSFLAIGGYSLLAVSCYYSELAIHSQFAAGYLNSLVLIPGVMLFLAKNRAFKKGATLI